LADIDIQDLGHVMLTQQNDKIILDEEGANDLITVLSEFCGKK
jgi:hypothetical protein